MKSIETLIPDIYEGFQDGFHALKEGGGDGLIRAFGDSLGTFLAERLVREDDRRTLRLSNAGTPCDRKLWYSINRPELGERLTGPTRIKFLYGDLIEQLVIFLARSTGHTVTDEQRTVEINGVKGHIDGFIDGTLVDVKSASTYSFRKFEMGLKPEEDGFGYLTQLGAYAHAVGHDRASFIVVDKTLGNLTLDTHDFSTYDIVTEIERKKNVVASDRIPDRGFSDVPEGVSGNRKLGVGCSYCGFKFTCWPGLKGFAYSNGPTYLTKVVRQPKVPEIKG